MLEAFVIVGRIRFVGVSEDNPVHELFNVNRVSDDGALLNKMDFHSSFGYVPCFSW